MKGVKRIPEKVTLDIREKKNIFRKERLKEGQKDTRYQREKKERKTNKQEEQERTILKRKRKKFLKK